MDDGIVHGRRRSGSEERNGERSGTDFEGKRNGVRVLVGRVFFIKNDFYVIFEGFGGRFIFFWICKGGNKAKSAPSENEAGKKAKHMLIRPMS